MSGQGVDKKYHMGKSVVGGVFRRASGFLLSFICPVVVFITGSQAHQSLRDWMGK